MSIQLAMIPKWLSNYTIISELGRGAFSTVYKIKSNTNGNTYCLKKISLKKTGEKLNNEVTINKRLSHINLVKYCDSHIEEDYMYIIMEFCEYGDLYSLLRSVHKHKLYINEDILWDIAYQGLIGLEYLHSKKVIHRDIKLLNIFMTKDKLVKIGDMGMSKLIDDSVKMNLSRVGTPLYLAPELVKKEQYDYKVDIWSFGCSLYHLAKCAPPFNEENLIRLGNAIVSETPPSLPETYSQEFKYFVNLLMCKAKEVRPTAMMALRLIPEKIKLKYKERFGHLIEKHQLLKQITSAAVHSNNNLLHHHKTTDSQSESIGSIKGNCGANSTHIADIRKMIPNKKRGSESVNNANDNLIGNAGNLIKRQFKFLHNKAKTQNATQDNFRPNSKENSSIKTQTCNNFYNFNINVYKVNFNKKGNCPLKEDNLQNNIIDIIQEKTHSPMNFGVIATANETSTGITNVFTFKNKGEGINNITMANEGRINLNPNTNGDGNKNANGNVNAEADVNANLNINKYTKNHPFIFLNPERMKNRINIDATNNNENTINVLNKISNKKPMNETNYPIFPLIHNNKNSFSNRNKQPLLNSIEKSLNKITSNSNSNFNYSSQHTTNKINLLEQLKKVKVLTIKDLK